MPECDNCGAHVSARFAHVFADDEGRLYACPRCAENIGIAASSQRRIQTRV